MALKLQIDDEAVAALAARLFLDLYEAAALTGGASHSSLEEIRRLITGHLANFPEDVIEAVPLPTRGAGKAVLRLRIRRSLKRDLALRAFNLGILSGHSRLLH
jgi:hypothetical protein